MTWLTGDLGSPENIAFPSGIDTLILAAGLRRDTSDQYDRLFVHGYGRLLDCMRRHHALRRVVMVSTTGVFAERDGGEIDEQAPAGAASLSGSYYQRAEELVRASGIPCVIARLSGIYGPDRIRLIREVAERRARRYSPPPHYLNHLHADDAAGALAHLAEMPGPDDLYIVSDREPADRNDVLNWLARRMGMPEPPVADDESSRPARRSGNKRCRSDRLVASGYRFTYPTYREGYEALVTGFLSGAC